MATQQAFANPDRRESIVAAVNGLNHADLERLDAWTPLSDLSSRTTFEAIDADPSSLILGDDGSFEIDAAVYITLVYGPSRDEVSLSDEYPAVVRGSIMSDGARITELEVDTSSFYR